MPICGPAYEKALSKLSARTDIKHIAGLNMHRHYEYRLCHPRIASSPSCYVIPTLPNEIVHLSRDEGFSFSRMISTTYSKAGR